MAFFVGAMQQCDPKAEGPAHMFFPNRWVHLTAHFYLRNTHASTPVEMETAAMILTETRRQIALSVLGV